MTREGEDLQRGTAEYIRRLEECLATGERNLTACEFRQWAPNMRLEIERAKKELENYEQT